MTLRLATFLGLFVPIQLALAQVPSLSMAEASKKLSEGGYVLMMRHAATDGLSDPPGFKLEDCASQLNLNNVGKEDAKKIGEAFKSNGIKLAEVSSSEFCRCKETAQLAFGNSNSWSALNGFAPNMKKAEKMQSAELKSGLAYAKPPKNLMWVTHQSNITALTGYVPPASDILAVRLVKEKGQDSISLAFRFSPLK